MDVYERPEAYTIYCELPGARREDLQLEVRGDNVYVQCETKFNTAVTRYATRSAASEDSSVVSLWLSIKRNEIKAKFELGVLELTSPRTGSRPRKKINIA